MTLKLLGKMQLKSLETDMIIGSAATSIWGKGKHPERTLKLPGEDVEGRNGNMAVGKCVTCLNSSFDKQVIALDVKCV